MQPDSSTTPTSFDEPQVCDLLITNVQIFTMDAQRTVYRRGAIAVAGRTIAAIGREEDVKRAFRSGQVIDGRGGVAHPGFVDAHVHFMNTARGVFPDTTPIGPGMNLYKRWWGAVEAEDEYAATLLTGLELLSNGTTCFMEAGTIHETDAAASAAEKLGLRGLVGDPFVWDTGAEAPDEAMSRAPRTTKRALDVLGGELRRNADPDALVHGHVVLFGNGSATDELELAAKAAADAAGAIMAQHQSFGPGDAGRDDERHGAHPLVHLEEIGVLGDNCTFSHMNHLRPDEMRPVVDSGMAIAWCPATAMTWGTGATIGGPHLDLYRRGVPMSLGSDGANSSCRYDIGLQGLLGLLSAREREANRAALAAEDVFEMATLAGAKAAGMSDRIGSLEVGKRADIVLRTTDVPEAQPGLDPLQAIVYSSGSKSIDTVIVDGRISLKGGHPTGVDTEEVYDLARRSSERMMKKLGIKKPESVWPTVD